MSAVVVGCNQDGVTEIRGVRSNHAVEYLLCAVDAGWRNLAIVDRVGVIAKYTNGRITINPTRVPRVHAENVCRHRTLDCPTCRTHKQQRAAS